MDTKTDFKEKRKFQRVNIPGAKVSFKLLDPRTWSTYQEKILEPISNISLGGVAFKTINDLSVKTPVGVDIKISPEHDTIRTFGRIAWIERENPQSNVFNLGISFSWWKHDEDKKLVYEAIKKEVK